MITVTPLFKTTCYSPYKFKDKGEEPTLLLAKLEKGEEVFLHQNLLTDDFMERFVHITFDKKYEVQEVGENAIKYSPSDDVFLNPGGLCLTCAGHSLILLFSKRQDKSISIKLIKD